VAPKLARRTGHPLGAGMREMIEKYLLTYKGRLKLSTFIDYRSILQRHLCGFTTFEEISQGLEEYLAGLDVSGKRKNNVLSAVKSFMLWAVRCKLWPGPFFAVPRFKSRSAKIKPLSPDESRLIMRYAAPPYKDYFQVGILTGMRVGELLGLKFEDFDVKYRVITVRRALVRGAIGTTKTVSGDRDIPLSRAVWEIYQRRIRGNDLCSPWFFYSNKPGAVLSRSAIARAWRETLRVFNVKHRPLYATRHTFASLAMAAGEDPLWIAKVMGHSRPDQLFLRYSSFMEGVKRDGDKLIELVVGKQSFLRVVP